MVSSLSANEKVEDINGSPRSQSQMVSVSPPLFQLLSILNALCTLKGMSEVCCLAFIMFYTCGNKPTFIDVRDYRQS